MRDSVKVPRFRHKDFAKGPLKNCSPDAGMKLPERGRKGWLLEIV